VEACVVAIAKRFPTLAPDEPFVIADGTALATALDADAPGTGEAGELWLSVPDDKDGSVTRALARPPYSGLEQLSRRRLSEAAGHEPLARGVVTTLGVTALVALALALVGLWATVLGDLRDERDGLFDLEAQGVGPGPLRKQMRIRALALLAFGLLGGCVLGFLLSRFVVSVVQVTATATHPDPPLVVDLGAGTVALALGVLVLACLVAIELTLRHAFRGDVPERASWSLE
jgi:ABC-type antimicrobial peptide transport system permease subunit